MFRVFEVVLRLAAKTKSDVGWTPESFWVFVQIKDSVAAKEKLQKGDGVEEVAKDEL